LPFLRQSRTAIFKERLDVLRITWAGSEAQTTSANVEGELVGPHVEELARLASAARAGSRTLVLDLTDVTFADHAGLILLRTLRDQGVALVGASGFINGLIDAPSRRQGAGGTE
jgi:hypothetical protein